MNSEKYFIKLSVDLQIHSFDLCDTCTYNHTGAIDMWIPTEFGIYLFSIIIRIVISTGYILSSDDGLRQLILEKYNQNFWKVGL